MLTVIAAVLVGLLAAVEVHQSPATVAARTSICVDCDWG